MARPARRRSSGRFLQQGEAEPSLQKLVHMNDDAAEKQKRRQSKRLSILPGAVSLGSPGANAGEDVDEGLRDHLNNAAPQVPIMANFEEWMKMVNDNKINAQNSWNFALIDYFHDMSLLKEGDGINFQRASVTLDGCMKIYSSRIDSAATETGRLLTGLATKQGREDIGNEGDEEGGEEEEGEEGEKKKKPSRPRGVTLAKSFEENAAKKLELELSIDPLFKKMCADFDEGGAKGMLMNSLGIDKNGRVVFDGDFDQEISKGDFNADLSEDEDMEDDSADSFSLHQLGSKFFPDLSVLATKSVCPSAGMIEAALKDPSNLPEGLQLDNADDRPSSMPELDYGGDDDVLDDAALDMGFDDLGDDDGPGPVEDFEFGYNPMNEQYAEIAQDVAVPGGVGPSDPRYKPTINEADLLAYFDHTLKKNWAGPEHWKVQKLRGDIQKKAVVENREAGDEDEEEGEKDKSKKKAPVEVDFVSEDNDIDEAVLFARPAHMSTLALSKNQQRSDTNNLLPNDEHFSTDNLVKLFIKPGKRITGLLFKHRVTLQSEKDADQHFWAQHFNEELAEYGVQGPDPEPAEFPDQNDAGDDFGGYDDFDDYGGATDMGGPHNASFLGLPKAHPEYVSYAKVAKRVDVRKLKDNLWRVMDYEKVEELADMEEEAKVEEKKFTQLVEQVGAEYPRQQKQEISTSFVFICLLHLANEKGLSIDQQDDLEDLAIHKDMSVRVDQLGA
ncbi:Condensin complex subunit 2 [Yarrowia sp. B02]|nr:Condensin complex subunit 2 [Yarrowia sp. B02]